jgi:hypothetical protein
MLKKMLLMVAVGWLAMQPAAAATIALGITDAFAQLGASCGGIHEQNFATGFDHNGNVAGYVYLKTTCSTGGRGSTPHTYSKWLAVTWNLSGVPIEEYASVPTVDPSSGGARGTGGTYYPHCVETSLNDWTCYSTVVKKNLPAGLYKIRDSVHIINQAACSATNTAYCTYRAVLTTP